MEVPMKKQKNSQLSMVLDYLKKHGSLDQKQAIKYYGAYRLAAIIYTLRQDGYNITTTFKTGKNRYGCNVSWAEYTLAQ